MKLSNTLVKLPQISQTMREMSMEMTKARLLVLALTPVGFLILRARQG